jgi:hypothetical protein
LKMYCLGSIPLDGRGNTRLGWHYLLASFAQTTFTSYRSRLDGRKNA